MDKLFKYFELYIVKKLTKISQQIHYDMGDLIFKHFDLKNNKKYIIVYGFYYQSVYKITSINYIKNFKYKISDFNANGHIKLLDGYYFADCVNCKYPLPTCISCVDFYELSHDFHDDNIYDLIKTHYINKPYYAKHNYDIYMYNYKNCAITFDGYYTNKRLINNEMFICKTGCLLSYI